MRRSLSQGIVEGSNRYKRHSPNVGRLLSTTPHSGASSAVPSKGNNGVPSAIGAACKWMDKNFLLLGIGIAIAVAKGFPELGSTGGILKLNLATKWAAALVFLIQGLSIRLDQLGAAVMNWKVNLAIQSHLFVGMPILAIALAEVLSSVLSPSLLTGLLALSCLPTTINMCVVLTDSAGGDRALALLNAVVSNILGIFVTPILLMWLVGESISVPFFIVLTRLAKTVLLPLAIGQVAQRALPAVQEFRSKRKKWFSRTSEMALITVVWQTFSDTFKNDLALSTFEFGWMLGVLPLYYALSVSTFVCLLRLVEKNIPAKQLVAAVFTSTQKTLAFGLPLLQTIFQGNEALGIISAPLLVYHPMQMLAGALMQTKAVKMIANEKNDRGTDN